MNITPYCQRYERWADTTIGTTGYKMGRWGCTITSLASIGGCLPDEIAKKNWFNSKAEIIWNKIDLPNITFAWRYYSFNAEDTEQKLKEGKGVLLQVSGNHWVTAKERLHGLTFLIMDPWHGDFTTTERYGNKITGSAVFVKRNGTTQNDPDIVPPAKPPKNESDGSWIGSAVKKIKELVPYPDWLASRK